MGLNVLFVIAAVILVWKDREDFWRYIVIVIAAMFLAGTPVGQSITQNLGEFATWIDTTVKGWLS